MLNSKQIYNRLNECFLSEYGGYESEAEWYGTDTEKVWLFYIPSQNINVRLTLNEVMKRISIEERREDSLDRDYEIVGQYKW